MCSAKASGGTKFVQARHVVMLLIRQTNLLLRAKGATHDNTYGFWNYSEQAEALAAEAVRKLK